MLFGIWALGAIGCVLGAVHPAASGTGTAVQAVDVIRLLCTLAMCLVFVLGPGLAMRAFRSRHSIPFALLPFVGMGVLVIAGAASWGVGLAGWPHPRVVATIILGPVMAWVGLAVWRTRDDRLFDEEETGVLLLIAGALLIAVGRSLWSLDAPGELYAGTIYRTLEVSDRPDSRISFHVVALVANSAHPYGAIARAFFSPYSFSSRGPLPGIASAPIVLISGGRPLSIIGTPPWTPFDPEGFMSYRLAMMTFACASFFTVWALTRRLAGRVAARVAVLIAATTPFIVHEIWFTWPKLLAASFVLLAAVWLLDRRPVRSGLLVGIGYLCHPLTLLSLPALGLGALWPQVHPHWRRPHIRDLAWLVVGCLVCLVIWRLANGAHDTQSGFLNYIKQDGFSNTLHGYPVTLGGWINDRATSIGNTLVPLRLFLLSAKDQEVNAVQACFPFCSGGSPAIVHFFYQYWTGVPFGLGILFYPLVILSTWRALRRWPWPTSVAIIVSFVVFAIYWGGAATGLLREGMHTWVLSLIVLVAVEQSAAGFGYLTNPWTRAILVSRVLGVLLVAVLPTIVTTHTVIGRRYVVSDVVALGLMVVPAALLGRAVWAQARRWTTAAAPASLTSAHPSAWTTAT